MEFKDLLVEHDYYCSDNNYYSNNAAERYDRWEDFYAEMQDADVDWNLVFRWDIRAHNDENLEEGWYMEIFVMQQRRGKFVPFRIEVVEEKDFPEICDYLKPHYEKLQNLWQPFSSNFVEK